jgi:hypothetical protein
MLALRRLSLCALILSFTATLSAAAPAAKPKGPQPNFVVIYADDK